MADENKLNLGEIIEEAASNPASASVDGQTFISHNIKDLIAADRYLASKKALANGRKGFKINKLVGGSVND